jgi:tRNA threonylcarbamoyladenosine biosynthesis protein TsaE
MALERPAWYDFIMLISTKSAKETQKIAQNMAQEALKVLAANTTSKALIISLQGHLGAGKTTFTQGFARGLGIKEKVASPTFVIMKKYAVKLPHKNHKAARHANLYHIDCYRIRPEDLWVLGFKEMASDSCSIVLLEWGDRVKRILPKERITIEFRHAGEGKRRLMISA